MKKCPHCLNPIYDRAKRCMFCGRNLDLELARRLEKQRAEREKSLKSIKFSLLVFGLLAGVTLITLWTAIYSPIGSNAKQAATQTAAVLNYCNPAEVSFAAHQLIGFNDRWAYIMAIVVSVDRDMVVLQVDRLQKIRRDARRVEVPDCMKSAKLTLTEGMDEHIQGLFAYIREEPLEDVNDCFTKGNFEMNSFADEVERLQQCAPNCW